MTEPRSIWELVEWRARRGGDALFAADERGHRVTFGELRDDALRVAAGLAERGIGPGSVVSWQLPNWIEAATLSLALTRLGAVQNPLIPILGVREVGFICRQAGTELLIVPDAWRDVDYPAMAARVRAANPGLEVFVATGRDLPRGDPARLAPREPGPARWYYYTSGTTADPKGARHTDVTLLAGARGYYASIEVTATDVISLVLPLTHIGGICHVLTGLVNGAALSFVERFDPDATARQLRDQGATVLPGSLPFVQAFESFAGRHPELEPLFPRGRIMTHGGSPKPPRLFYETRDRFGLKIVTGYGMTECPMLGWSRPGDADHDLATSEGRPVPGVELVIVRPDGTRAGTGEEGEIRVRGPQLMLGYVDPALDAGALDEDGFFRSGDLGHQSGTGHLTITGRLKDVIIRNMENVSAIEVENLLFSHPGISDVAVVGLPDPRTGERVCAVVVPADPAAPPTLPGLAEHLLAQGLSTRKLPEQLELIDVLPRNGMNKVLKAALRERLLAAPAGGAEPVGGAGQPRVPNRPL